jgi:hypothetical protein
MICDRGTNVVGIYSGSRGNTRMEGDIIDWRIARGVLLLHILHP